MIACVCAPACARWCLTRSRCAVVFPSPRPQCGPALHSRTLTPNAFMLPGDVGPCPTMSGVVHDQLLKPTYDRYIPLLAEAAIISTEARDLLCYVCWDSQLASRHAMNAVMDELHAASVEEPGTLGGLTMVLEALLSMADSQAVQRAMTLVVGSRPRAGGGALQGDPGGFMDLLSSLRVPWQKRWTLVRWAVLTQDSGSAGPHLAKAIAESAPSAWLVRGACVFTARSA